MTQTHETAADIATLLGEASQMARRVRLIDLAQMIAIAELQARIDVAQITRGPAGTVGLGGENTMPAGCRRRC